MNVRDEPTATPSTATASATSVTVGWDAIHAHTRRTVLTTSNVPTGGPALIGLKTDLSRPREGHDRSKEGDAPSKTRPSAERNRARRPMSRAATARRLAPMIRSLAVANPPGWRRAATLALPA